MNLYTLVHNYGGVLSSAEELYTSLFRIGDGMIQRTMGKHAQTDFIGNPIIYHNSEQDFSGSWKRYIVLEDTCIEQIHDAQRAQGSLINACTYYGKRKDSTRMDKCFGLIFDLDDVDETCVNNLLFQCRNRVLPMPNYIVVSKSGHGLHLYYLFDQPLRMYPNLKVELKELKYVMTKRIWNPYTSKNENAQFQSFDQSFMVAGSTPVMQVYQMQDIRWSIDELAELSYHEFHWDKYKPSTYTKEEAKTLFPEWYEAVVVRGEKRNGRWTNKRALYDWWIRQIKSGAMHGTRYWCIMCLVIYAIKCDISKKEVKKDIYRLKDSLNEIAPDFPFTDHDIQSALDAYDTSFATFPRDDIARLSRIPIQKNKRNYRPQKRHLERARAVQAIDYPNGEWRRGNGRKPQHKETIIRYFEEHPDASVTDCASDLNVARSTVYRWKPQPKKV